MSFQIHGPYTLEWRDGRKKVQVEVFVDARALAELLGLRATRNASGIAKSCYGAVMVKVIEPKEREPLLTDEERAALKEASK